MTRTPLMAAAFALIASTAQADEITLQAPMAAASLHDGGIDMVVYFMDRDDHYEVVATYATVANPVDPARLRMGLADGDRTEFSLPGLSHVSYAFSRTGQTVRVEATERSDDFALNRQ